MDELRARIKPYPTVLQLHRGMAKLAKLDTGNIEVERLPLDMQAVPRDSPASFHELRIVLGRPIARNHVDLAGALDRFLHKIHMLQHSNIDGGDFSCVMAPQNMIHLIQRRQVIVSGVITIPNSQSFVRVHVEEGEFTVRKFVRTRDRWMQQPATEQQQPDHRRFQERSTSPRPGIWMLQETAPGEDALQSVTTTPALVSKAPRPVNPFLHWLMWVRSIEITPSHVVRSLSTRPQSLHKSHIQDLLLHRDAPCERAILLRASGLWYDEHKRNIDRGTENTHSFVS